ncbi:translation initiation factor IF-2-like [Corvus kubaryi]|uniref:translation initiation factor IF-2-like n=1 Tax=Corvus kubaryi TaxID=68294 RepID=UPI001C042B5A|nr:translation initiation factor IF-2-like [Corvus kubaryi]
MICQRESTNHFGPNGCAVGGLWADCGRTGVEQRHYKTTGQVSEQHRSLQRRPGSPSCSLEKPPDLRCSVCGAGSCAPRPVLQPGAPARAPHAAPIPGPHGLFSKLLWPRAGCPRIPGPAGLWRGAAPRLPGQRPALGPLQSPAPAALAGPQRCAGRGGQGGPQAAPGQGAEPAPTLPSWRSLQLAEDRSRAAEHSRRALPYLRSPQESLRQAAIRFIGIAGRHLRGQQEELQLICEALEDASRDISPAVSSLARQTAYVLWALERAPRSIFQVLRDGLCRACRTWPRLSGRG